MASRRFWRGFQSGRWRGTPLFFVLLKQIGSRYRRWGLMQALMTRRKAIVSALGAAAAATSTFPVVRAFAQGSLQATPSAASAKKLSSLREPVSVPDYELLAHERMSNRLGNISTAVQPMKSLCVGIGKR